MPISEPIVYKMYDRLQNNWFLVVAKDGNSAIKKSKIILGNRYNISYHSPNAHADLREITYQCGLGLGASIKKALKNDVPLPMFLPELIGNLAG